MAGLGGAFSRLSTREKYLVGGMLVVLFLALVFFVNLWLGGKVSALETNVEAERASLANIYGATDTYVGQRAKLKSSRDQAIANEKLNLATAIAQIANEINLESIDRYGNPEGQKRVKAFLEFKGEKETSLTKRRRNSKNQSTAGYYRRSQEVTIKENATFNAIYELLEKVEENKSMLFVTGLRLERSRNHATRVRSGTIEVSTYFYKTDKE